MEVGRQLRLAVSEASEVGEARRLVALLASRLGMDAALVGAASLLATEAATNLVKHSRRQGELLIRAARGPDLDGIEILSLDSGPGMENVAECLRDGYSTAGSPGTGLGAITRLADEWDLFSLPGRGTALLIRLNRASREEGRLPGSCVECGCVSLPKSGEEACGDAWSLTQSETRARLFIADGLGHGPFAAQAATEAVAAFNQGEKLPLVQLMEKVHGQLRGTRGAAVAVAEIDLTQRVLRFVGVGNISGTVVTAEGHRSLTSHDGTMGHDLFRLQQFTYPWPADSALVMHSDGLATRWELDQYPGLSRRHPAVIAGMLYRDYSRGRDDITISVLREKAGKAGFEVSR